MKQIAFIVLFIGLNLVGYSQEKDQRDVLVGTYTYETTEYYPEEEKPSKSIGELKVSKSDRDLLKVEVLFNGGVVTNYYMKITKRLDTLYALKIEELPSSLHKNHINKGANNFRFGPDLCDGIFTSKSKDLEFAVQTDVEGEDRSYMISYICRKKK